MFLPDGQILILEEEEEILKAWMETNKNFRLHMQLNAIR